MSNDPPLVSVVMPVFNSAKFLREAIDSVLAQSYSHLELLTVDDGSTDGSVEILRSYTDRRVRVWWQGTRGGPAAARNLCLENAQGEYVGFFDSDDVARPEWLSETVAFLRESSTCRVVAVQQEMLDEGGNVSPSLRRVDSPPDRLKADMLFVNQIGTSGLVMHRDAIGSLRFDVETEVASDYEMWLRVLRGNYGPAGASTGAMPEEDHEASAGLARDRRDGR